MYFQILAISSWLLKLTYPTFNMFGMFLGVFVIDRVSAFILNAVFPGLYRNAYSHTAISRAGWLDCVFPSGGWLDRSFPMWCAQQQIDAVQVDAVQIMHGLRRGLRI